MWKSDRAFPGEVWAIAAAALLYVLTTAYGVLNDGFHSDDWRHVAGVSPLWTAVEGRWVLEVIFRDLLGERFLLPVQLALAFPCLYWVARTLARHAAPEAWQPSATLAIFAVAANHIFLADALSFASNVFAYPLAIALSVGAFDLIARVENRSPVAQGAAILAAAQLLALSLGIYQTYAVAGLIVPVLALLRIDRVTFAGAVRLAVLGAIASVLAIALYLGEWRLYAALKGVAIVSERFSGTDAAGFTAKLDALPALVRSLHTGTLMVLPFVLRATMGLFSLAAIALFAVAALRALAGTGSIGARVLPVLRIGIGLMLALFIFPVLFWLGYEGDPPPARAFGYIGFWIAAIFALGLTLAGAEGKTGRRFPAGLAVMAAVGVVFALTSSAFWYDSARVGARDKELARAIDARLAALPGYAGPPFRIVGGVDYPDLSWGSLAGWSSFHAGNPRLGIFKELYGRREDTASLPVSPRACHAFPAADAAFVHHGMAYLCLEDFQPFTAEIACAPLAAGGEICLGPHVFVHIADTCLATGPDDPEMRVAFHYEGRSFSPERSFSVASFPIPIGGKCFTTALAPGQTRLAALSVLVRGADGKVLSEERIDLSALRPYAAP
ncbi:glucosyltransferase domain-containing protein [Defluviimonas sp. SAOS-178_SWC]|uniref:glucosyltransferase domain-containing protein n=1 Tax=Defluviimonas sp. SAOS-178_SWC TaxID=3121287 RepID=UPI0032217CCC